LLAIVGTGTEVGKTWITCRLLEHLRRGGVGVAARKPVQSFAPGSGPTDAELLAAASGEARDEVCLPHRSLPVAMAPPMAAEVLGWPPFTVAELATGVRWPEGVAIGLLEAVGGVWSPAAEDGHSGDLVRACGTDGAVNAVRGAIAGLRPLTTVVLLNRYDPNDELHVRNRRWLGERDGLEVFVDAGALAEWACTTW
jgi:dethiobiotin synthetase